MATNTVIASARATAMLDNLVDAIDAAATAGYVEIRTGAQPANPGVAATGTLLATITLNDPAFGAAAYDDPNNWAEADADIDPALSDSSADATGTAGYFRVYDGDDTAIMDGTVGTSDADMIVNTTSLVSGSPFTINSWQVRLPTGE